MAAVLTDTRGELSAHVRNNGLISVFTPAAAFALREVARKTHQGTYHTEFSATFATYAGGSGALAYITPRARRSNMDVLLPWWSVSR
jgi:hypothetical protein